MVRDFVKKSYDNVIRYILDFFVILITIKCTKSGEHVLANKIYEGTGKIREDKCYGPCNFSTTEVNEAKNIAGRGPSTARFR